MVATRSLPARFVVARDVLAQDASLLQVTTGPRGEILALSIDRNPWSPDFARPPYQYTITCWRDGSIQSLRLTNVRLVLTHIVRTGSDAFMLVAERVRGEVRFNALIVGDYGVVRKRFRLHSGVEDIQADLAGNLWVSYEDEATMAGSGIAEEGLVCLGPDLAPRFRFNSLAKQRGLPRILNVYALNVASEGDAYVYYYGVKPQDPWCFTFLHLHDAKLVDTRKIAQVEGAKALAVDGSRLLLAGVYDDPQRLTLLDLATGNSERIAAVDPEGQEIRVLDDFPSLLNRRPYWGRGSFLYLLDARGVWEVALRSR